MYIDENVFTNPLNQAFGEVREIVDLPAQPDWQQVSAALQAGERLGALLPFSGIAIIHNRGPGAGLGWHRVATP